MWNQSYISYNELSYPVHQLLPHFLQIVCCEPFACWILQNTNNSNNDMIFLTRLNWFLIHGSLLTNFQSDVDPDRLVLICRCLQIPLHVKTETHWWNLNGDVKSTPGDQPVVNPPTVHQKQSFFSLPLHSKILTLLRIYIIISLIHSYWWIKYWSDLQWNSTSPR